MDLCQENGACSTRKFRKNMSSELFGLRVPGSRLDVRPRNTDDDETGVCDAYVKRARMKFRERALYAKLPSQPCGECGGNEDQVEHSQ
jgi:hypothetical protein